MERSAICLSLAFLAAVSTLFGQSAGTSSSQAVQNSAASDSQNKAALSAIDSKLNKNGQVPMRPFSRVAFGGGISLMGINLQAATNVNQHMNLRGTGNVFQYSVSDISINGSTSDGSVSTNGLNLNGQVKMAAAGVSLDYYPFARHGFRLSPGVLLYNENGITANATATSGTFTLNGSPYYAYSSTEGQTYPGATPLNVAASLGLNTRKQAATITTGWGNMIPRRGGHWSFPFEIGAAFTGEPSLNVNLTGWACIDQAQTGCSDVTDTTNPIGQAVQSNLAAQVTKWKSDLNPLQVYPIISFGVSYAFR